MQPRQVIIRHTEKNDISFKKGVLDLNPVANIDDVDERRQRVQTALEKGL